MRMGMMTEMSGEVDEEVNRDENGEGPPIYDIHVVTLCPEK